MAFIEGTASMVDSTHCNFTATNTAFPIGEHNPLQAGDHTCSGSPVTTYKSTYPSTSNVVLSGTIFTNTTNPRVYQSNLNLESLLGSNGDGDYWTRGGYIQFTGSGFNPPTADVYFRLNRSGGVWTVVTSGATTNPAFLLNFM